MEELQNILNINILNDTVNNVDKKLQLIQSHDSDNDRDLVLETVSREDLQIVISEEIRSPDKYGRTSGSFGTDHIELIGNIDDWFRIIGAPANNVKDIVCQLLVRDIMQKDKLLVKKINIFRACTLGYCECMYFIAGVSAQLKPCRMFAECYCRGDVDPDWEYMMRGVCFGFKVINDGCKSEYSLDNYSSINKVGNSMQKKLEIELAEEMISVVSSECLCVHPFGAIPKGDSDFRAIVDCSRPDGACINNFTDDCKTNFSYNSVQDVSDILCEGNYMATTDISNAYRAINIYPTCRNRQGLSWDFGKGKIFLRDNRLCMGLSSSPYVFSKISDFVVRCMVRAGFNKCINYLDDFCVVGETKEICKTMQWTLVGILRRLGFFISYKKLVSPAKLIRFLGINIDSVEMTLSLPEDKVIKLKKQLALFINRRKATKKELESLAGILAHCCKVVHGGRTFSRRVYDLVSSVENEKFKVRLNEEFKLDLQWWLKFIDKFNGYANIIRSKDAVLSVYSDASRFGFGATFQYDWVAGTFDSDKEPQLQQWLGHHFEKSSDIACRSDNINILELWPILLAVNRWGKLWKDRIVVFITDNTQVKAAINTGRSRNKLMMKWLRLIFWESIQNNFEIQSVYINTKVNIVCDSLSRLDKFKSIARIRDVDINQYMCCHKVFYC